MDGMEWLPKMRGNIGFEFLVIMRIISVIELKPS
jgi:hypothetical protein